MAEKLPKPSDPVLNINRRALLAAVAATSAATIAPFAKPTAARPAQISAPAWEGFASNLSSAMARRLAEIEARNQLRREARLPLLSIPKELRRMKKAEDSEEFGRFEAIHRRAVWDEVLKGRREYLGNPNWRPKNSIGGMGYQSQVHKILWRLFRAERRPNFV